MGSGVGAGVGVGSGVGTGVGVGSGVGTGVGVGSGVGTGVGVGSEAESSACNAEISVLVAVPVAPTAATITTQMMICCLIKFGEIPSGYCYIIPIGESLKQWHYLTER
ncbi:hypothetical protein GCM10009067_33960 [Haloarcula sebkhae]|uniref:Uncharacterized protein n=1 Tax=Haloarcula sebkhae TaxID=932660 RepID=A0A830EV26_9EURY|nr:hypothetical protein GCM10009067_33960 [Haloarcula sebkhae]